MFKYVVFIFIILNFSASAMLRSVTQGFRSFSGQNAVQTLSASCNKFTKEFVLTKNHSIGWSDVKTMFKGNSFGAVGGIATVAGLYAKMKVNFRFLQEPQFEKNDLTTKATIENSQKQEEKSSKESNNEQNKKNRENFTEHLNIVASGLCSVGVSMMLYSYHNDDSPQESEVTEQSDIKEILIFALGDFVITGVIFGMPVLSNRSIIQWDDRLKDYWLHSIDIFGGGFVAWNIILQEVSVKRRLKQVLQQLDEKMGSESPEKKTAFKERKESILVLSDKLNDSYKNSMINGIILNGLSKLHGCSFLQILASAAIGHTAMDKMSNLNVELKKTARLLNQQDEITAEE